jgi:hypothetical protein
LLGADKCGVTACERAVDLAAWVWAVTDVAFLAEADFLSVSIVVVCFCAGISSVIGVLADSAGASGMAGWTWACVKVPMLASKRSIRCFIMVLLIGK